ncbi:MAG: hypothetical protein Ta2D_02630 [Rickettsiales bacterium]|nr:MAG: hypothetical protein Ta2D_02630 [Rickettsiales bacterium]
MDDLGYRIQNVGHKNGIIRFIGFCIIFMIFCLAVYMIGYFIINLIRNSGGSDQIITIQSPVKNIKRYPEKVNKSGTSQIYDVIDNKDGDMTTIFKKPPIIKTAENNEDYTNIIADQEGLADIIDDVIIDDVKPKKPAKTAEKVVVEKKEPVAEPKYKAGNETAINNIKNLEKLGNASLVKNLKQNKDMKPSEYKIQLSASSDRAKLLNFWNETEKKYQGLFKDKTYYIENYSDNNLNLHKLQIGTFETEIDANSFCNDYIKLANKKSDDCIVVRDK